MAKIDITLMNQDSMRLFVRVWDLKAATGTRPEQFFLEPGEPKPLEVTIDQGQATIKWESHANGREVKAEELDVVNGGVYDVVAGAPL